jgi:predicted peroxiredoxin
MAALALLALGCSNTQDTGTAEPTEPVRDGVFVHITDGVDEPHDVLMALQMAAMWSESHDVLVYFDIEGVQVVLKDSEDLTFSHFPSSHTSLQRLHEAGVPIMVCPGCLKAAGKTEDDIMEIVQIADQALFFGFTEGRILTLDY